MYNIGYCSYQDPRLVPPNYWNEPDDRPTREDIVGQYTVAALKALNRELDAENQRMILYNIENPPLNIENKKELTQ